MRSSLPLTCLSVVALGVLATSAQAQTLLFNSTFDAITPPGPVPNGAAQQYQTNANTQTTQVQNTNAATLFPSANTASAVVGGDAGTAYALYGTVASSRLRSNTITGLPGTGLFSVIYDINQTASTAANATAFSLLNSAATDANISTGTFTAFSLNGTGVIAAGGTATLTGGTATTILTNTQYVLSLVVNPTAAAISYTSANVNGGNAVSLPALNSDLYASSASGVVYIGRLTTITTGVNTNPNQIAFSNFNNSVPNLRINEVDVYSGANVGVVPEPSTYAVMALGTILLGAVLRRRTA